jgi:hypothetical protein
MHPHARQPPVVVAFPALFFNFSGCAPWRTTPLNQHIITNYEPPGISKREIPMAAQECSYLVAYRQTIILKRAGMNFTGELLK